MEILLHFFDNLMGSLMEFCIYPVQGHNTDYIISMVPLSVSDKLANRRDHGSWPGDTELVSIEGPTHTWLGEDGRSEPDQNGEYHTDF